MPQRIRVAVTGLSVSRAMMRFYRESPDTELVLLHDIDGARAKEVSTECGGVPFSTDFDDVLKSGCDMVDVSTPNHCHAAQAIAALKSGKHVLCQKPIATTVQECQEMIEAAAASKRQLGILMSALSQPLNHSLKAIVQKGLLGRIASVRHRMAHRLIYKLPDRSHWRADQKNVGGGSFMQLGVHFLNLLQWMLEDDIVAVSGFARNLHSRHALEGEDIVTATGEFRSGPLMSMESCYCSVGSGIEVYGTEGHFILSGDGLRLEANAAYRDALIDYPGPGAAAGSIASYSFKPWDMSTVPSDYPHIQQLAFARAIRDGAPFPMSGAIGLRDVVIAKAIYQSSETCRVVNVADVIKGAVTAAGAAC